MKRDKGGFVKIYLKASCSRKVVKEGFEKGHRGNISPRENQGVIGVL